MLYDTVLKKKQAVSGVTSNPTMEAFDLDYCMDLDGLYNTDEFVKGRVDMVVNELNQAGGIDFNDHYKVAYDAYNEAVCYYDLMQHGFQVQIIPETSTPTPDFKVEFAFNNWQQQEEKDSVYVEIKSLSFADGNLEYKRVQERALNSQIRIEAQHNEGRNICSSEFEVSPLGVKDKGLTSEIEILNGKIEQNIKKEQYKLGNGQDTLLLVDMSQYTFPFKEEECLPVYPDLLHKCSSSGRLWMIAFGRENERIFNWCEFEGKGNFDADLKRPGILNTHDYIKGIIFRSGSKKGDVKYYGLYRKQDEDLNLVTFLHQLCSFVNDDENSYGFRYFESLGKQAKV